MIAVDSNLLVYAHRADSPWHEPAATCLAELAEGSAPWGLPWPCIHEFLAIVTHPRIYQPPTPIVAALDQVSAWLESPSVILLAEAAKYWEEFQTIAGDGRIAGPQVHDARIAALCEVHAVRELWSADRDLSRFARLRTRNPLVTGEATP